MLGSLPGTDTDADTDDAEMEAACAVLALRARVASLETLAGKLSEQVLGLQGAVNDQVCVRVLCVCVCAVVMMTQGGGI